MKYLKKPVVLSLLISLSAFAQIDSSVTEQMRITQETIRIASQEIENGAAPRDVTSADSKIKLAAFNKDAAVALKNFENNIQRRILEPLQILINQYNQISHNTDLPQDVKLASLTQIKNQISSMSEARNAAYFDELLNLMTPLKSFPVAISSINDDWSEGNVRSGKYYPPDHGNGSSMQKAFNWIRGDKSIKLQFFGGKDWYLDYYWMKTKFFAATDIYILSYSFDKALGDAERDFSIEISRGCYTSICFYDTFNAYTAWATLVTTTLNREISISLNDGSQIIIEAKPFARSPYPLTTLYAMQLLARTGISPEMASAPSDIRAERLNLLTQFEESLNKAPTAEAKQASCKKVSAKFAKKFCAQAEGCLSQGEKAVINHRNDFLKLPAKYDRNYRVTTPSTYCL